MTKPEVNETGRDVSMTKPEVNVNYDDVITSEINKMERQEPIVPSAPPPRPRGSLSLTPEKRRKPFTEHNHVPTGQSDLKTTRPCRATQLLNIPHHVKRYRELQQVELSETSFEELMTAAGTNKQTVIERTTRIPEPSLSTSKDDEIIRDEPCLDFELPARPHPLLKPSTLYFETT